MIVETRLEGAIELTSKVLEATRYGVRAIAALAPVTRMVSRVFAATALFDITAFTSSLSPTLQALRKVFVKKEISQKIRALSHLGHYSSKMGTALSQVGVGVQQMLLGVAAVSPHSGILARILFPLQVFPLIARGFECIQGVRFLNILKRRLVIDTTNQESRITATIQSLRFIITHQAKLCDFCNVSRDANLKARTLQLLQDITLEVTMDECSSALNKLLAEAQKITDIFLDRMPQRVHLSFLLLFSDILGVAGMGLLVFVAAAAPIGYAFLALASVIGVGYMVYHHIALPSYPDLFVESKLIPVGK